MDNSILRIPHFGKVTPQDATNFIQQMLEYCMLHDSMKETVQDSHVKYYTTKPDEEVSQAVNFFAERTNNDCLIITDFMLNRCRELIEKTGRH